MGPGNILFVFLFAQVGASAPIPTEMISPHSRVKQTHLCHQDNTLYASQRDGGFMQTRPGLVDVMSARPASDTRKMVRAVGRLWSWRQAQRRQAGRWDALELETRMSGQSKSETIQMIPRDLVKEARTALESAASRPRHGYRHS